MEKHIETFLNKLSYTLILLSTLILLYLVLQTPSTCLTNPNRLSETRFPTSTCDPSHHRPSTTHQSRTRRIQTTKSWTSSVSSYASFFKSLHVSKHSRALIVSAGPGQPVVALHEMGLEDVTGVEVVESVPLVAKVDLNNLPFFDGVFDFGFGVFLDRTLFPDRYVQEIERTVRVRGVCVVGVGECGVVEANQIAGLFKRSKFVRVENVSIAGERRTTIVMKVNKA